MRGALVLARKEFRDILRERSIVLALLTQFFVAAFSAFLTVGLVGLYDPESVQGHPPARLAYVGPGGFDEYLAGAPNLQVDRVAIAVALDGFHRGLYAAVVEEGAPEPAGARTLTLLLPESEVRTPLLIAQLKSLLRTYERDLRFEREERLDQPVIYVETDAEASTYYAFTLSVLLPLLALTPVFLAGAITGDSLSHEVATRSLLLLRASPLTPAAILLGKLLTPVLLVPVQVGLWMLLLSVNGLELHGRALVLLFATTLGLLVASLSSVVALVVRREGQTQAAYTLLVLLLFSLGFLLPREPFNLIARVAAGSLERESLLTIGLYGAAAVLSLGLAAWVADRRMKADAA